MWLKDFFRRRGLSQSIRPPARMRSLLHLEPLEGRDTPGNLTVTYAALTHTLTVVGDAGSNSVRVQGSLGDPTHFFLTSSGGTINGQVGSYSSPSGVQNLVFRMLAGSDGVSFDSLFPVRVQGSVTFDGGDGATMVYVPHGLRVVGNLTILSGTGYDMESFVDLSVGGAFTIRNSDGGSYLTINRSAPGVSTIGGAMTVVNGAGRDETRVFDLNVGGNLTIQNGLADSFGTGGYIQILNYKNSTIRSQIRGSVSLSFANGSGSAEISNVEIGGDASFGYGTGIGSTDLDAEVSAVSSIVRGSVTVSGTGRQTVFLGTGLSESDLLVGGRLTVIAGPGADIVNLGRVLVSGATSLWLGEGNNTTVIDDCVFAGTFSLLTGSGADTIKLETSTGTKNATTFKGAVTISEGAGADSLTLAGPTDAGQAIVALGTFVVHHGAGADLFFPNNDHLFFPFGTSLAYAV
jgi:hypothetical protein